MKVALILLAICALTQAQQQEGGRGLSSREPQRPTTTPVPILRQINKVNEDGSFTYGYENGDGSYKIETKDAKGQVNGKYGYYDDAGTLREVEYGASKSGFYPTGTDINAPVVAPHRETDNEGPQDGSYDPELFTYPYQHGYDGPGSIVPAPVSAPAPALQNQISNPPTFGPGGGRRVRVKTGRRVQGGRQLSVFQQSQPQQQYEQPQQQYQPQQYQQPQQQYQQPQQQYQPQQYQQPQQNYYQPQPQPQAHLSPAQHFQGHPARNIDLNTGSYSVNYSG